MARKAKKHRVKRRSGGSSKGMKGLGAIALGALAGYVGSNYIASMLTEKDRTSKMALLAPVGILALASYVVKNDNLKKAMIAGSIPSALMIASGTGIFGTIDITKKTPITKALFLAGAEDPLAGDYVVYGDDDDDMNGEYVINGNDDYNEDPLS